MTIQYIEDASIGEVLDFTLDNLVDLGNQVRAAREAINGLRQGPLGYDAQSALIAAQLLAGIRSRAEDCVERLVIDLATSWGEQRPATNVIARAAGVSVTKVKAMVERAEPLPEPDDE